MFATKTTNPTTHLVEQAALSADIAVKATQRAAQGAMHSLADSAQDVRHQAHALAQRGVNALHDGSQHLREGASHASDSTLNYIRDEPAKSVLIAAAVGAVLMALIGLLSRSQTRG